MESKQNYYRILEISTRANEEQIKLAYRRLVKIWHPDVNNNSPESQQKLKDINEAYEILSDPMARTIYNQTIYADEAPRSSSSAPKSAQQTKQEQEAKKRRENVRSVYENRGKNADVYYTEFEKILDQYKNDRCDSGFLDKVNIVLSDTKGMDPMLRAYATPLLFFIAVFWHGCDLVARGINGFFGLFQS